MGTIFFRNKFQFGLSEIGRTDIVAQAYNPTGTVGGILDFTNFTETGDGDYVFEGQIEDTATYVIGYRTGDTTIRNTAIVPFDQSKFYGTSTSVAPTISDDSLATPADADSYFATRSNTAAWENADNTTKQNALNDGTRFIDQFSYVGRKTDSTQVHEWPRYGIIESQVLLDKDIVPQRILYALYEIAFAIVRGVDPERELKSINVLSRGFASVRTTYDPGRTPEYLQYGCPSGMAWLYLLPYLLREGTGVVRLHRVN